MSSKNSITALLFFMAVRCFSQTDASTSESDWVLFEDSIYGYSVEYPSEWIAQSAKGGFMCGKEPGFRNAEFTIWLSDTSNTERMDFLFGMSYYDLYEGWKIEERSIFLDGKNGVHFIITNIKNPEDYLEIIELREGAVWYSFQNNVIEDVRFDHFYRSFRSNE